MWLWAHRSLHYIFKIMPSVNSKYALILYLSLTETQNQNPYLDIGWDGLWVKDGLAQVASLITPSFCFEVSRPVWTYFIFPDAQGA